MNNLISAQIIIRESNQVFSMATKVLPTEGTRIVLQSGFTNMDKDITVIVRSVSGQLGYDRVLQHYIHCDIIKIAEKKKETTE